MTYYIFIEKYDGTQLKFFVQNAKERDAVLRYHNIGIKFKAWSSSGKKYKICDIANLEKFFPCSITDYDSVLDVIFEIRHITVTLPKKIFNDDPMLYKDIIKMCKEAENFLTYFDSFMKNKKVEDYSQMSKSRMAT